MANAQGKQRSRWASVSGEVSCAPMAGNTDPVRERVCDAARKYFCGSNNNNDNCVVGGAPSFSGISTRAAFSQAAVKANQMCADAYRVAHKACAGPFDFRLGQGNPVSGIEEICRQLQHQTDISGQVNAEVAGYCNGKKLRCNLFCAEAVEKIKQAAASCKECVGELMSPSGAWKSLNDSARACQGFTGTVAGNQAREAFAGSNASKMCGNMARQDTNQGNNQNTQSAASAVDDTEKEGGGIGNPLKLLNDPRIAGLAQALLMNYLNQPEEEEVPMIGGLDAVDCSVNPNLAGCYQMAAASTNDSWNTKGSTADMAAASSMGAGNFAIDVPSDMDPASADAPPGGEPSAPPTVGGVPNNGGGVPGGSGGGPATLGPGGAVPGGSAPSGSKTDVLHGVGSSGGMGAMAANMNMKNGESGGGYTYGQGQFSQEEEGLDLSQFLPGGKQDPFRKLAGASSNPASFQIQSKDVNIWARISARIKARCSQGLLRDCIP